MRELRRLSFDEDQARIENNDYRYAQYSFDPLSLFDENCGVIVELGKNYNKNYTSFAIPFSRKGYNEINNVISMEIEDNVLYIKNIGPMPKWLKNWERINIKLVYDNEIR